MNNSRQSSDMSPQDRHIRVFISSTFRDMHAERELLIKQVFPELRRICAERFVTFTEVDLRWGITEEQSAEGKVLPICLEEIHRCRPYFIGLLGERYGWIPDSVPKEVIEREPWLKAHVGSRTSVTELEILHGVLNNPEMTGHAFFYFRDPAYLKSIPENDRADFISEDAESADILNQLKARIRQSGFPVMENYPAPEALANAVREQLKALIDRLYHVEDVPDQLNIDDFVNLDSEGEKSELNNINLDDIQALDLADLESLMEKNERSLELDLSELKSLPEKQDTDKLTYPPSSDIERKDWLEKDDELLDFGLDELSLDDCHFCAGPCHLEKQDTDKLKDPSSSDIETKDRLEKDDELLAFDCLEIDFSDIDNLTDHIKAVPEEEALQDIEYQRKIAEWKGLPWWKRSLRKKPELMAGPSLSNNKCTAQRTSSDKHKKPIITYPEIESPANNAKTPVIPSSISNLVHFSITSPTMVIPGNFFLMDVWAHLDKHRKEVIERAREQAMDKEIAIRTKGPVKVTRGNILVARPTIQGFKIDPVQDTILWEAEIGNATFTVDVPVNAIAGIYPGTCDIYLNGLKISTLKILVNVGIRAAVAGMIPVQETRLRRAFASYASEDRYAVLGRVQGLLKGVPGLDVFLDVVSLRSGERWEDKLRQEILDRDVLYLFWSQAAKNSIWVDFEWRFAFSNKGLDFIDPVPLVSPMDVEPPPELADLHFNDWVLAYMRRNE